MCCIHPVPQRLIDPWQHHQFLSLVPHCDASHCVESCNLSGLHGVWYYGRCMPFVSACHISSGLSAYIHDMPQPLWPRRLLGAALHVAKALARARAGNKAALIAALKGLPQDCMVVGLS